MVYLWQVRILRLAWLQHAAAWAGIPVLYSSEEPAYNRIPQVGQLCPNSRPRPPDVTPWQERKTVCMLLHFLLCTSRALF